jgi:hypothetical protein
VGIYYRGYVVNYIHCSVDRYVRHNIDVWNGMCIDRDPKCQIKSKCQLIKSECHLALYIRYSIIRINAALADSLSAARNFSAVGPLSAAALTSCQPLLLRPRGLCAPPGGHRRSIAEVVASRRI